MSTLSWLVDRAERMFPCVPTLTREEIGWQWQPPEQYYFLDDPSPRIWQRIKALLRCDARAISFWRKREQYRKLEYHSDQPTR